jgi:hypothetical protein
MNQLPSPQEATATGNWRSIDLNGSGDHGVRDTRFVNAAETVGTTRGLTIFISIPATALGDDLCGAASVS